MSELIYDIDGARGRNLKVFDDRCIITTKATIGALVTGNITDGEKTIYYVDCIGVQFKKANITLGYLQLETASSLMNNRRCNFFNENSFTFEKYNEIMEEIADYIKGQLQKIKEAKNNPMVVVDKSPAEELKEFKELLDMGIISQEEFDTKKKQILGL